MLQSDPASPVGSEGSAAAVPNRAVEHSRATAGTPPVPSAAAQELGDAERGSARLVCIGFCSLLGWVVLLPLPTLHPGLGGCFNTSCLFRKGGKERGVGREHACLII